jgi:hypothetical protein
MSALLAWLEPLKLWVEVNPPALGIEGTEPPTPGVEVETLRAPCVKMEDLPPLKEGPALPKVGLCERK